MRFLRSGAGRLQRGLRGLSTRLRRDASPIHAPDFSDAALRAQMRASDVGRGIVERALARGDGDDGQGSARSCWARHLLSSARPRFFFDAGSVAGILDVLQRTLPGWSDVLAHDVRSWCETGLPVYGTRTAPLASPFDWESVPLGPGSDDLYRVRVHRFGFMPRLVIGTLTGALASEVPGAFLGDWMQRARAATDPGPYRSTLVVAQRFLALTWSWHLLADRPVGGRDDALAGAVLTILAADARYLLPLVGTSVGNNHLLAEYFVAWFVQFLFPELAPRGSAPEQAARRWEEELLRQTYPDGGSFEHCTHYHEFACEMAVAYLLLCSRNDVPVRDVVTARTRRMLRFQREVGFRTGAPLALGDATEDPMFPLDADGGWAGASFALLASALFPDEPGVGRDPRGHASAERAIWLLGGATTSRPGSAAQERGSPRRPCEPAGFDDSGIHLMHDPGRDASLIFRSGPAAGVDVFAGHVHADLMSVYLRVGSRAVIDDAGTYTYRCEAGIGEPGRDSWRRYLMGPEAHNGLVLGSSDPLGDVDGAFRPRELAVTVETERGGCADALTWVCSRLHGGRRHDGWERLVVHVPDRYWIVVDDLSRLSDRKRAALHLQFAADLEARPEGGALVVSAPGGEALARVGAWPERAPRLHRGDAEPPAGWISPRYGVLEPAWQARYRVDEGCMRSALVIAAVATDAPATSVVGLRDVAGGVVVELETREATDRLFVGADGGARFEDGEIAFRGRALWTRSRAGRTAELRAVDVRTLHAPALGVPGDASGATGRDSEGRAPAAVLRCAEHGAIVVRR